MLNKLSSSGEEAKVLCGNVDETQQRNIIKEWFSQSIVFMISELPDYPQQLGVIENIFKAIFPE